MRVEIQINDNADRMAIIEALQRNGHEEASIRIATEYIPQRVFVVFDAKETEIR